MLGTVYECQVFAWQSDLHASAHLITQSDDRVYYGSHFIDEQIEAQRSYVNYPMSHTWKTVAPGIKPRLV